MFELRAHDGGLTAHSSALDQDGTPFYIKGVTWRGMEGGEDRRGAELTRTVRPAASVGYVRATRTSLPRWVRTGGAGRLAPRAPRTVRTGYAYQPRAYRTYCVPRHPRSSRSRRPRPACGRACCWPTRPTSARRPSPRSLRHRRLMPLPRSGCLPPSGASRTWGSVRQRPHRSHRHCRRVLHGVWLDRWMDTSAAVWSIPFRRVL